MKDSPTTPPADAAPKPRLQHVPAVAASHTPEAAAVPLTVYCKGSPSQVIDRDGQLWCGACGIDLTGKLAL